MAFLNRILQLLWPRPTIRFAAGTRAAFIGRPGSGKTTLIQWLLRKADSVLVYDTKMDPEEWQSQTDYAVTGNAGDVQRRGRHVLKVPVAWLRDVKGWGREGTDGWNWTVALDAAMARGQTWTVYDEALLTLPWQSGHPSAHRQFQQGRSAGVGTFVGSQMANNLDTRVLRLAEHVIAFRIHHHIDREELQNALSVDCRVLSQLRDHEFAYCHESAKTAWVVFRPINLHLHGWFRQRIIPREVIDLAVPKDKTKPPASWREIRGAWIRSWFGRNALLLALMVLALVVLPLHFWWLLPLPCYLFVRRVRSGWWRVVVDVSRASKPDGSEVKSLGEGDTLYHLSEPSEPVLPSVG
jgi:hypothetical protein